MSLLIAFLIGLALGIPLCYAVAWLIGQMEGKKATLNAAILTGNKYWTAAILLTTGAGMALAQYAFGNSAQAAAVALLACGLVVLSFVDLRTFYLPDILTLPLIALGLIANALGLFVPIEAALIGALAGYSIPWLINFLFRLIRKKDGMGGGDFKLLAALGAWAGWVQLPLILFLASLIGLVFALLSKVGKQQPFPFGPALSLAGLLCLCYGGELLAWYANMAHL